MVIILSSSRTSNVCVFASRTTVVIGLSSYLHTFSPPEYGNIPHGNGGVKPNGESQIVPSKCVLNASIVMSKFNCFSGYGVNRGGTAVSKNML